MNILVYSCTGKMRRTKRKDLVHTAQIHGRTNARMCKDTLNLRCKEEKGILLMIKKWFYAQGIAEQNHFVKTRISDGNGIAAAK